MMICFLKFIHHYFLSLLLFLFFFLHSPFYCWWLACCFFSISIPIQFCAWLWVHTLYYSWLGLILVLWHCPGNPCKDSQLWFLTDSCSWLSLILCLFRWLHSHFCSQWLSSSSWCPINLISVNALTEKVLRSGPNGSELPKMGLEWAGTWPQLMCCASVLLLSLICRETKEGV